MTAPPDVRSIVENTAIQISNGAGATMEVALGADHWVARSAPTLPADAAGHKTVPSSDVLPLGHRCAQMAKPAQLTLVVGRSTDADGLTNGIALTGKPGDGPSPQADTFDPATGTLVACSVEHAWPRLTLAVRGTLDIKGSNGGACVAGTTTPGGAASWEAATRDILGLRDETGAGLAEDVSCARDYGRSAHRRTAAATCESARDQLATTEPTALATLGKVPPTLRASGVGMLWVQEHPPFTIRPLPRKAEAPKELSRRRLNTDEGVGAGQGTDAIRAAAGNGRSFSDRLAQESEHSRVRGRPRAAGDSTDDNNDGCSPGRTDDETGPYQVSNDTIAERRHVGSGRASGMRSFNWGIAPVARVRGKRPGS